jgi:hypothetical protein
MVDKENEIHPEHPQCPFVTKEVCINRTRNSKWAIGVFIAITTVLLGLVVYTADASSDASKGYVEMTNSLAEHKVSVYSEISVLQNALSTHQATQIVSDGAIADKLDEIKDELSEQRKEQRVLLEKILEIQILIAGEHP